jgi:hypothetical protein
MLQSSVWALMGLGFLLGLKHATDADHIVAVTTMLGKERRLLRSCWIGAFWGIGHTFSLMVAGIAVVLLKTPISPSTALWLETAVAVMLVVLGARVLLQSLHKHEHAHGGSVVHTHWHLEGSHAGWAHFGLRPVAVGMVHGAAGSAALTLLVLSTISSVWTALTYILIFGIGSIFGMLGISLLIALPISWAGRRLSSTVGRIQAAAGAFSCAFGVYLGIHLWF